jgi:transglutaminase-like putative cysteine protease
VPEAEEQRIAGFARKHGARVDHVGRVVIAGHPYAEIDVVCRDNADAIRLLNDLAKDDASTGLSVRSTAKSFMTSYGANGDESFARAVHRYVRDGIEYVDDPAQIFRAGDVTLILRIGNCVNTARLIVGLCEAAGVTARAVPVVDSQGEITHTAAQIQHGGAWHWAEATIGAAYGEAPHAAARRLGIEVARSNISGAPP